MVGWVAICARHRTLLARYCPTCGVALSLPDLALRKVARMGYCDRCDQSLAGLKGRLALDIAGATQARLLALKHAGQGELPGIGGIAWATLVCLVDAVLSAVWRSKARFSRESLFDRVVRDIGLDAGERLKIDWSSNYGALILLGWLLAGWPGRMTDAMNILRAPALDGLIDLLRERGNEPDPRLMKLLVAVVPARRHQEEEWALWLDSLPISGEELRQWAQREFRQGQSERLKALADLRDGVDIAIVATRARLHAATIERWLDAGMAYGFEALTAETVRIPNLEPEQRAAITSWLDGVSRPSSGPGAWSAEHAQQEIATRFGVLLTAKGVISLVTKTSDPWGRHLRDPFLSNASPPPLQSGNYQPVR